MFGMAEALLSFLRRQVGLRTDAASASGSLHGKTKDVKAAVSAIASKNIINNGSAVKSVQRGMASIASGSISQVMNISAVDMSKTLVIWGGAHADFSSVELTATTTVTAYRGNTSSTAVHVRWQVIEFY